METTLSISSLYPKSLKSSKVSVNSENKLMGSIIIPNEARYIEKDEHNKCTDIIKKYFIETSIHGLKYIYESKRHAVERIFWLIAVSTLACLGGYLIYQVRYFV